MPAKPPIKQPEIVRVGLSWQQLVATISTAGTVFVVLGGLCWAGYRQAASNRSQLQLLEQRQSDQHQQTTQQLQRTAQSAASGRDRIEHGIAAAMSVNRAEQRSCYMRLDKRMDRLEAKIDRLLASRGSYDPSRVATTTKSTPEH